MSARQSAQERSMAELLVKMVAAAVVAAIMAFVHPAKADTPDKWYKCGGYDVSVLRNETLISVDASPYDPHTYITTSMPGAKNISFYNARLYPERGTLLRVNGKVQLAYDWQYIDCVED
jgi:hypothetical protein